jgi:AcrR family transcriptional regulator
MPSSGFRRARRPEQKEQRRAAILAAAERLLAEDRVEGVSLTAIADRVGLAKSNVYRYFEGREQILLAILQTDLGDWIDGVTDELARLAGGNRVSAAARAMAAAFVARPRLCELISVLSRVLEPNVSEGAAHEFNTSARAGAVTVAEALHRALPTVPRERCLWAQRVIFAMVAGLWPQSRRPTMVERPSFADDLAGSFQALLYGLLMASWRDSGRPVDPT